MTEDLSERLRALAAEMLSWRLDAQRLEAAAKQPDAKLDDALLLSLEVTSGKIYAGIASFDALADDIDQTSHTAAGQIAEVGDSLRLLLMEITELGTRLYALRSNGS